MYLVLGVAVRQLDFDPSDGRKQSHDVARVGCDQVREVWSALRRRQPQQDLHVAAGRYLTRDHEPKRGDRLIELGIVDLAQRLEDAFSGIHAESTSCASSLAAGVPASSGIRNSSGTSIPYSLAALRPRIFLFPSVVSRG